MSSQVRRPLLSHIQTETVWFTKSSTDYKMPPQLSEERIDTKDSKILSKLCFDWVYSASDLHQKWWISNS